MKRFFAISLFCLMCIYLSAQDTLCVQTNEPKTEEKKVKLIYDVEFKTRFDNRESHIPNWADRTKFGTRLSPEIGVQFIDNKEGMHTLIAGASWWQPIGKGWKDATITPTLYYNYFVKGFSFSMGFIPWRDALTKLPNYLMSNQIVFETPNIRGALISYRSQLGYAEFLCDWRALPTTQQREAFRLILAGEYKYHWFSTGGIAHMNHLANKLAPAPKEGVCDDITLQPYVKFSFDEYTPMDVLFIRLSYLFSYQNDRKAEDLRLSHGLLIDFSAKWRFISATNTFYYGTDAVMPFYEKYQRLLYQGSSIYSYPLCNKASLKFYIVERDFVDVTFAWNLIYVPNQKLAHSQILTARFLLSPILKKHAK